MPPTGSTRPRSVISPVIARFVRTGRPVSSEASAVAIVTPADGPSFGIAPAGTWTCMSTLLEEVGRDAEAVGARADVAERRLRRLLHHVAELAGEREALLARHARRLDEEDVAAGRRPREPDGDARLVGALGDLGEEPLGPEELAHRLARARRRGSVRPSVIRARDLAADAADLALEVPQARLARVGAR